MKSRVFKSESQIRRIVQDEAKRQTTEIYDKAMQDSVYQAFAVMMCVLHKEFGFGKERLHRLKDLTEDEFMAMKCNVLGRSYTTNDCVRFLKENYDIDFSKSQYDESWDKQLRRK